MFLKNAIKKVVTKALNDNDTIFFLTNDTRKKYKKYFAKHKVYSIENTKDINEIGKSNDTAIIFVESYNDTSILQANNIAKAFKYSEKYAKVFVLALECSEKKPVHLLAIVNEDNSLGSFDEKTKQLKDAYFDKLITTNSTGVLEPQDIEGLLVIDVSQELKQDKIKQQKFQKYSDKCLDLIYNAFASTTYCCMFLWLLNNLPYKNYNIFNILVVMMLSGCFLWILTQLSFVICDYVIKALNTLRQNIELNKITSTSTIGQVIEKILYCVGVIIIIPFISIIHLIVTSVGIIEKLCLKVKSWLKIKK